MSVDLNVQRSSVAKRIFEEKIPRVSSRILSYLDDSTIDAVRAIFDGSSIISEQDIHHAKHMRNYQLIRPLGVLPDLTEQILSFLDDSSIDATTSAFNRRDGSSLISEEDRLQAKLNRKLDVALFFDLLAKYGKGYTSGAAVRIDLSGWFAQNHDLAQALTTLDGQGNRVSRFPNATELDLSNCQSLTDAALTLLQYTPRLKSLKLNHFVNLSSHSLVPLKELEHLSVNSTGLKNADIERIVELYPNLRSISLNCCPEMNCDEAIRSLTKLRRLERLDLGFCEGLTDEGVLILSKNPILRSLNGSMSNITDVGLGYIAQHKLLEELDVSLCSNVTNIDILRSLPKLQRLNLEGCGGIHRFDVVAELKQLRDLDLSSCENATGFESWWDSLNRLERLNLEKCTYMSRFNWLAKMTQLRDLNLSYCPTAVHVFGQILPDLGKLERLYMRACRLKDSDCEPFIHLSKLTELDVSDNQEVNVLSHLRTLKHLRTLRAWDVSYSQRQRIAALRVAPSLEWINDIRVVPAERSAASALN